MQSFIGIIIYRFDNLIQSLKRREREKDMEKEKQDVFNRNTFLSKKTSMQ